MRLTLVAPPARDPVHVGRAKEHLRITGDEDDLLIQELLDAAVQHLDGYRGVLGRCLVTQTWRADFDRQGDLIALPFPDVAIQSAEYTDVQGGTLSWRWHEAMAAPTLLPEGGWGRPLSITFTAGFGGPDAVPQPLRLAILMLVDHWYNDRGATGAMVGPAALAFDALIAPYKRWRL